MQDNENSARRGDELAKWRERLIAEAAELATTASDPWDVKMAARALGELKEAFATFTPYKDRKKVTIFGSARIAKDSLLYRETQDLAARLAACGFMVVTGAGPGIMHAGLSGAGRANSLGVMIEVPFEHGEARELIGADRVVSMRYLFTRKLMLFKESHAFVAMPGGFGTMDELFELLTLLQTGKGSPVPFVLLDEPGGVFWRRLIDYVEENLVPRGLIDPEDLSLVHLTDDIEDACEHIEAFYANFQSVRLDGRRVVLRVIDDLADEELEDLNHRFSPLCETGRIERCGASEAEIAQGDSLHLRRLSLTPVLRRNGALRELIDAINEAPARRVVPSGVAGAAGN